ncbi:MAG: hypothetical protein ACFE94_19780 [Candidatus Hodarchaeota archaeon]
MEELELNEKRSFIERVLDKKILILIFIGIIIRIIMLIYYYFSHAIYPSRSWGDVGLNFNKSIYYPPLSTMILDIFRILSFGSVEIFAFWAFLWDLGVTLMFYFVLKSFNIKNSSYAFGLFLINPFFFLNNSFSLENCGYHITDMFFFFFLFMALIYYPKEKKYAKYLFYIFLGLSMCTKYYTLPALGFLFLKFLYEKNWEEIKMFVSITGTILVIFLIAPILIFDKYLTELLEWYNIGETFPLYIRIIPITLIALFFIFYRLKESDTFEIIIVSIIAMGSFMFFSFPYLRWFQSILFYGILIERDFFSFNLNLGFFKREIKVTNHILTFYLSFIGVLLAYALIFFGIV